MPAVLFLVFNRPNQTHRVFEQIARAKPGRLYIAGDGPRQDVAADQAACAEVRALVSAVDWKCEVQTLWREENLGCRDAVSSAIDWFFDHEEEGIILEDDCLPVDSFFGYCRELLERHRDNPRIMMVSGNSFLTEPLNGGAGYYFSRHTRVWGWATWRRAWQHYDVEMKALPEFLRQDGLRRLSARADIRNYWMLLLIQTYLGHVDTWDYQWFFAVLRNDALSTRPAVNLIENIGMGPDATHTTSHDEMLSMPASELQGIQHPEAVVVNEAADLHEHLRVENAGLYRVRSSLQRWRKRLRRRWRARKALRRFLKNHP